MNKNEAIIEAQNLTQEYILNTFCPLAKRGCSMNCVCFSPPRVFEHNGEWKTGKPYCNNAMFFR